MHANIGEFLMFYLLWENLDFYRRDRNERLLGDLNGDISSHGDVRDAHGTLSEYVFFVYDFFDDGEDRRHRRDGKRYGCIHNGLCRACLIGAQSWRAGRRWFRKANGDTRVADGGNGSRL